MANEYPNYNNYSVFFEGLKLGKTTKATVTVKSNADQIFDDEGFDGNTKGNVTFEATVDLVMPFGGIAKKFEDLVMTGKNASVLFGPINGRRWECTAFSNECSFEADMEKRRTNASLKLQGGKPKISG
jgi:hypothetical protein